jgi:tetratricopeptide (TPR) repeat protein
MRMKPAALFFSAMLLSSPTSTRSQTPQNDAVVSVQDLALSGKAGKAFMKGTELLSKGDAAASVEHFLKAIELAPASYRPYHNLALAYLRLGQLDRAAYDFQKSIDITRGAFAPSLFGLSMILYKRAEFLNAKLAIERGLDADPTSAIGKYCLSLVQFSLGHFPEAERSALEAIARGGQLDAYILLARIHERANKPAAVFSDVQSYLRLAPNGTLRAEGLALLHQAQLQLNPQSASLH